MCAAPAYAQGGFFAAIDDLPLPPGFTEQNQAAAFDGENGAIVLARAEGEASVAAVRDFYAATLPQLGWAMSPQLDGVLVFQRGREELSFTVERRGARTWLGARLVTRPASMNAD
jgi:hypothetical protein